MPQGKPCSDMRPPIMSDHDLFKPVNSPKVLKISFGPGLTAFRTRITSKIEARSFEILFKEYSSGPGGLSDCPYPSISGATTRYPARTQGPI